VLDEADTRVHEGRALVACGECEAGRSDSETPLELRQDLGAALASGRTAEIFAWGEGRVIKRFRHWVRPEDVLAEMAHCKTVADLGLPVPKVRGLVELGGALAIVFERIDGGTTVEASAGKPLRYTRLGKGLGELHATLHATPVRETMSLPDQRHRLREKIEQAGSLSESMCLPLVARLDSLPSGDRVCHGDFHPENVLRSTDGRAVIIDWIDATIGDPLADVARTVVLIEGGPLPDRWIDRVRIRRRRSAFLKAYLRTYFRRSGRRRDHLRPWIPVVAAARLSEVEGADAVAVLDYLARVM